MTELWSKNVELLIFTESSRPSSLKWWAQWVEATKNLLEQKAFWLRPHSCWLQRQVSRINYYKFGVVELGYLGYLWNWIVHVTRLSDPQRGYKQSHKSLFFLSIRNIIYCRSQQRGKPNSKARYWLYFLTFFQAAKIGIIYIYIYLSLHIRFTDMNLSIKQKDCENPQYLKDSVTRNLIINQPS